MAQAAQAGKVAVLVTAEVETCTGPHHLSRVVDVIESDQMAQLVKNDGLGCGMMDYVDCTNPEGPIWHADGGHYDKELDSLEAYFRGRLNFWTLR